MIIFETPRLIVRRFTGKDYDLFYRLNSHPEIMRYIRPPRTREEADQMLLEQILMPTPHAFLGRWKVILRSGGEAVGTFVIIPIPGDEEKIQLGYALFPEHWGQGYATELTRAGISYFRSHTPLEILFAVTVAENTASENVLLKAGFSFVKTQQEEDKVLKIFSVFR